MKKFAIVGVILLLFTINASAVYWDLPRVFAGTQDVNGFAIGDDGYLDFGADNNLRITYDETTNDRAELTMTAGGMYFDVTDITFYTDDPTNESLTFTGFVPSFAGGIALADDVSATFGNDSDATITYDETTDNNLEIACSNGIAIESATVFDSTVQFSGVPTIIDDISLTLGTNSDATIKYDETTDDNLEITCANGIAIESATVFDSTVSVGTADYLTVGGVIVPQEIVIVWPINANSVDENVFIASDNWQITHIEEVHSVAGNDESAVNVTVRNCEGTDAPSAGNDTLQAVIDLKGTANTVQAGNLTATTADLQLSDGDRLALDYSGTLTNLAGGSITIHMKRI